MSTTERPVTHTTLTAWKKASTIGVGSPEAVAHGVMSSSMNTRFRPANTRIAKRAG